MLNLYFADHTKCCMFHCDIGDVGANLLARHYPNKNTTGQLLKVLNLWHNNLTIVGMKHIMKIVGTGM